MSKPCACTFFRDVFAERVSHAFAMARSSAIDSLIPDIPERLPCQLPLLPLTLSPFRLYNQVMLQAFLLNPYNFKLIAVSNKDVGH